MIGLTLYLNVVRLARDLPLGSKILLVYAFVNIVVIPVILFRTKSFYNYR